MDYESIFSTYKEDKLHGRYITLNDITPLLNERKPSGGIAVSGSSVKGEPIYTVTKGFGAVKILLWSQMHGNESTATKALFDLFNFLDSQTEHAQRLLQNFTFLFVPMLNPDGAKMYTRANANEVDLNRDFHDLTQPESTALVTLFEEFQPDYCYNLHDQRTIFGVADTGKPATISFLSPAFNTERSINSTREKAMKVIIAMNSVLQQMIPGQVGRFDDSFNINCAGDNFQFRGVPTILIEAGHFAGDYEREQTRKYFFVALLSGFDRLYENDIVNYEIEEYLNIPQNMVTFFDFVYKNVKINYDGKELITNFAAQYIEELSDNKLIFNASIAQVGEIENFFGHTEFNAEGLTFSSEYGKSPEIGQKATFSLGKEVKIVNGLIEM